MRMWFGAAALAAVFSISETAGAADNGIYLGAAVGESTSDVNVGGILPSDDDDRAFKLMGGVRPLDWLGIEVSYRDFGTVEHVQSLPFSSYRLEQRGVDAFAVFFREIAVFDLFAKAGVIRWDLDGEVAPDVPPASRIDVSDDGTDFGWGIGAQVRLRSLAVRLEHERFEVDSFNGGLEKPRMTSIGVTWTFF